MKALTIHATLILLRLIPPWPGLGDDGISVFEPVRTRSHTEVIRSSHLEYSVNAGGTVDMDNTTTRLYETFKIAFQNNVSLTIANTGNTTVKNPRVITNGKRRWWCLAELLDEILADARSDQERAYLIYDFVRSYRHHDDPIFADDELHDPVKMLNVFGAGLCDDSGYVGCSLFYHAGLSEEKYGRNPSERTLHGHMMCEAILPGGYQFLDIDENTFYLDLENELPVSGDAIAGDHYLAKREHSYGPIFKGWKIGEKAASLFGRDDGSTFRAVSGHRIEFDLRCGERIVYRWDNCGKFASDDSQTKRRRRFWGNSRWVYEPVLTAERMKADATEVTDKYLYKVRTLSCIGDLQYRYAQPNMAFWEEEEYEFELGEKPAWLSVDKSSGTLTGTPGSNDKGPCRVTVICRRTFGRELKPADYRSSYFLKDAGRLQSSCRQAFEVNVR